MRDKRLGIVSAGIAIVLLVYMGVQVSYQAELHSQLVEATEQIQEITAQIDAQNEELSVVRSQLEDSSTQMQATYDNITGALGQVLDTPNFTALGEYELTAYTLMECGKEPGAEGYGITANGTSLVGYSIHNSRYIGVNPNEIPYGSQVLIVFENPYAYLTGVYEAVDTGGAFKDSSKRIDVYFGETNVSEALDFGRRDARVYLLEGGAW